MAWNVPDHPTRVGLALPLPTWAGNLVRTPRHRFSSAPSEREKHDAPRVCTAHEKVRDPVSERRGLPRARSCDDEEGTWQFVREASRAVFRGRSLPGIQCVQVLRGIQHWYPNISRSA